jgi:nucleoside-diphosphate-sugar epimerase
MSVELDKDGLVVVAGAGGFIGGHLVARLLRDGQRHIRAIDNKPIGQWYQRPAGVEYVPSDLRLLDECKKAVDGARYVFDFAADMGGMGFIETHKADCMLSVLIGTHLLVAAREAGEVERFFFSSSACVYNADHQRDADVTALKEEDAYPALAEDGYGWEKLFTERMCRHFDDEFGITTRIARYHNVYGPLGTWNGVRAKAPAAICRKVAEAKLAGKHDIEIWGDGLQTRSFMYIDDCVEGTLRIATGDFGEPLNLGSTELVSINQLVDIVEGIAGITLERHYNLDAPQGVRGRNSDNTLLKAEVGWEPEITLTDGLERTYRWIYDEIVSGRKDVSDPGELVDAHRGS